MCEFCEGGKPVKNDREALVMLAHTKFGDDVMVMQVIEVWRGLFGMPKYAHLLFDFPVAYCPMCGRRLTEGGV